MSPAQCLAWPVRGVMVDPARLMERHEFYFDLLERMAEWGLNTLWLHLTDDEGFRLKLRSHPELASPGAFSRREAERLAVAAARRGISVVPEVESLGHARCITRLKEYAQLAHGGEVGFNAICPCHPRTLPLLGEIIAEVAALFPGPYFHAGMDEVNLGDCPRCRGYGRQHERWRLYARHVLAIHEIVRSLGREMIIWADHVENDPELLRVLPKDIILAHWHYTDVPDQAIRRSLKAGFRVLGCPSLCHWGDMLMPNAGNFANMEAMAETLLRLPHRSRVLGMVNTWWTPWRGLRDAYLPAVAYTGWLAAGRRRENKLAFARRYLRRTFGVGPSAGRAIREIHQDMLGRDQLRACLFDSPAAMVEALRLGRDGQFVKRERRLARAVRTLEETVRRARKHRAELNALVLAGEVAAACVRQAADLAVAAENYRQANWLHDLGHPPRRVLPLLRRAGDILRRMASDLAPLRLSVRHEWGRTRYGDDPKKGLSGRGAFTADCLLVRLDRGCRFLEECRRRFDRAVRRYPAGRRFPLGV